jgi:hypothetical protein
MSPLPDLKALAVNALAVWDGMKHSIWPLSFRQCWTRWWRTRFAYVWSHLVGPAKHGSQLYYSCWQTTPGGSPSGITSFGTH